MIDHIDHLIWVEKYRPQKIDDCILPEEMKKIMKSYVRDGEISSHLLLAGGPGIGKTTIAKALMHEIGADFMFINASLDRNIDVLRTTIIDYASKVSMFGGKRKYVILDEADQLTTVMQGALRAVMEELSANCGFILTCNFRNKIMTPLQDRCSLIEFKPPKGAEKKELLGQVFKRFKSILDQENVEVDVKALLAHINRYYPSLRKALNELQSYSKINGKIDEGILSSASSGNFQLLTGFLKERKFSDMRKWVAENPDVALEEVTQYLYNNASDLMAKETIPSLILHSSQYDYKNQFVVNKEINLVAYLTEVMRDVEFN